jgi:hypothetical protein
MLQPVRRGGVVTGGALWQGLARHRNVRRFLRSYASCSRANFANKIRDLWRLTSKKHGKEKAQAQVVDCERFNRKTRAHVVI